MYIHVYTCIYIYVCSLGIYTNVYIEKCVFPFNSLHKFLSTILIDNNSRQAKIEVSTYVFTCICIYNI